MIEMFIKWLLLFIISTNCCTSGIHSHDGRSKVFCVAEGSNGDDLCQHYNSTEHHTLTYYVNNSFNYFKSYETYIFQIGHHIPPDNLPVHIVSVANLSFVGVGMTGTAQGASVIECNGRSLAFVFRQSSNILFENLTFSACTWKHTSVTKMSHSVASLAFLKGTNLTLLRVTILMCVDEAFLIEDIAGHVILNSVQVANCTTAGKKVHSPGSRIAYRYRGNVVNQFSEVHIVNSRFINNYFNSSAHIWTYSAGLTINIECPGVKVKIFNLTMYNNTGNSAGNLLLSLVTLQHDFSVSVEISHSHFESGKSIKGGGMYGRFIKQRGAKSVVCEEGIKVHSLLHVYKTNFTSNVALHAGGGIFFKLKESLSSCNTEKITFNSVIFNKNSVAKEGHGGIAIHSKNKEETDYVDRLHTQFCVILVNCSVHSNYAKSKNVSKTGAILIKSVHYFALNNTSIFNNQATGIQGINSNIIFSHNISIVNNTGSFGGGLLLCQKSVTFFEDYTSVTIAHNIATHTGGGICAETICLNSKPLCFFQFKHKSLIRSSLVSLSLYDNHARYAGNNIFGGSIENCYMIKRPKNMRKSVDIFNAVFDVPTNKEDPLSISSPPQKFCPCQNNKPNCEISIHSPMRNLQKYPGETFYIEGVLVGQFNGNVPGTVQAWLKPSKNGGVGHNEIVQKIPSRNCTMLNYTIYTHRNHEVLKLGAQPPGDISGLEQSGQLQRYSIRVNIKKCPLGFSRTTSYCDCIELFRHHEDYVTCHINNQTIKRIPPVWIGYIESRDSLKSVAYHSHCPLDYCCNEVTYVLATENSLAQDRQCSFNRTGVLCGSCSAGLSSVLGSSTCYPCSTKWLLLVIPFALLGIVMVIGLTLLNITIADGTLSGIIFYCNVIGSNVTVFFQGQHIRVLTPLLKTFVSLINLETGMSLCFFEGMDAYVKGWLNFAFPLYVWVITGVLICLGGRCSWVVKQNAVKVLATLILLSYARLLSAVSEALQVSYVHIQNGKFEHRWLPDGNIQYFQGKHIPLASFALLISVLLLPFALCLCFLQCLQKASHHSLLSWINKLKPFFDAYMGPFTSSGRFWTGLLLLSRGILLIVSATNTTGNPQTVLGASTIIVLILLLVSWIIPAGLYRHRCLNALESSYLINLGIYASLLSIFQNGDTYSTIISHSCVGFAFFTCIGIIIYHVVCLSPVQTSIIKSSCYPSLSGIVRLIWSNAKFNVHVAEMDDSLAVNFQNQNPYADDREPLLGTSS